VTLQNTQNKEKADGKEASTASSACNKEKKEDLALNKVPIEPIDEEELAEIKSKIESMKKEFEKKERAFEKKLKDMYDRRSRLGGILGRRFGLIINQSKSFKDFYT